MGRIIRSKRGQGLIELGLALPILLLLSLGAIEIANMIDARLVLSHLTREGANMISLGTPADQPGANNDALDAIIDSACPLISDGPTGPPTSCPPSNTGQWTMIYSLVGSNPAAAGSYVVLAQSVRGEGEVINARRVCPECDLSDFTSCEGSCILPTNIPNLGEIAPGGTFNVIEVFYEYQPITPVSSFGVGLGNQTFYERAIF